MRGVLLALAIASGCATVPSGHAGVLVTTRAVRPQSLGEGVHAISPLAQVDLYDLRGQERDEDLVALASDGAPVEARASLVTFHVAPGELTALDSTAIRNLQDRVTELAAERMRPYHVIARAIAHAHELMAPTLTPAVLADEARRAADELLTAPSTTVVVGAPPNPRLEVDP